MISGLPPIDDNGGFGTKRSLPGLNLDEERNKRPVYKDYLQELRDTRPENYTMNSNENIINQYLNDKNLNEYEKIEAVKRKAFQMEEKARR